MSQSIVFRRPATIALALTLCLGLAACGGGSNPTPTVTKVSVGTVSGDNQLTVGEQANASATVTGTNNPGQSVTWSSSNPAVATVDGSGLITAVAPGTATITATSTVDGSQSGFVTVTVVAAPVTLTSAKLNFQPNGFTTPATFTANTGAAYDLATGIGWVTETSAGTATPAPLDMTGNTRNRTGGTNTLPGLSPEQYTQINMQCGPATDGKTCLTGTQTPGAFEYRVVPGTYAVTVSVGESVTTDFNSRMVLNVEGTNLVSDFTPSQATPFQVVTKTVTVTDGSLTVDAKGGVNTKMQYLNIAPAQ